MIPAWQVRFVSIIGGQEVTAFFETEEPAVELYERARMFFRGFEGKELCIMPFDFTDGFGARTAFNLVNYAFSVASLDRNWEIHNAVTKMNDAAKEKYEITKKMGI